jgi:hypothetical protein
MAVWGGTVTTYPVVVVFESDEVGEGVGGLIVEFAPPVLAGLRLPPAGAELVVTDDAQ